MQFLVGIRHVAFVPKMPSTEFECHGCANAVYAMWLVHLSECPRDVSEGRPSSARKRRVLFTRERASVCVLQRTDIYTLSVALLWVDQNRRWMNELMNVLAK